MHTPDTHIRHFKAISELVDNYQHGALNLTTHIKKYGSKTEKLVLKNTVYHNGGIVVKELDPISIELLGSNEKVLQQEIIIKEVSPWSAETPNLYTLVLSIFNLDGDLIETVSTKIGFRSVELKNGQMLVNGEPIIIKGVNRHEHDPVMGRTVDEDLMLKDFLLMQLFYRVPHRAQVQFYFHHLCSLNDKQHIF